MKYQSILAIICLFIYASCQTKSKSHTNRESYQTTETRRKTLEYHIENGKPYYTRVDGAMLLDKNPKLQIKCNVVNESDVGGDFVFYATLSCQGQQVEIRETKYIPAQNIGEFLVTKEIDPFSFKSDITAEDWGVIPPTVSVQETLTKYRDVER